VGSEAETVSRLSANPKLAAERQAKLDALGEQPGWWRPFARRKWRDRRAAILAIDISEAAAMLRDVYSSAFAEEVVMRPAPSFAMFVKAEGQPFFEPVNMCECGARLPFAAKRCPPCAADRVFVQIAWAEFLTGWRIVGMLVANSAPKDGPYR
jgi:hypothetical protein